VRRTFRFGKDALAEQSPETQDARQQPDSSEPQASASSGTTPPSSSGSSPGGTPSASPSVRDALPSPTVEEVETIVEEVQKEREAYLLVLQANSAAFHQRQVNGIQAVSGERVDVILRPRQDVRSVTARLYRVDSGEDNQEAGQEASIGFWRSLIRSLMQPAYAQGVSQEEWLAGYVFDKDNGQFQRSIDFPELPPGKYRLVITLNGEDGSREHVEKTVEILPKGVIYSGELKDISDRVNHARINIYRQTETGEYTVWSGALYGQENPLLSDERGEYVIGLPSGSYYFTVEAPNYQTYQSGVSVLNKPGYIRDTIALTPEESGFWYKIISWIIGLFR